MAKAINVSLPDEVFLRLENESKAIGISKSAYISMALTSKWQSDEVVKNLPKITEAMTNLIALSNQKEQPLGNDI